MELQSDEQPVAGCMDYASITIVMPALRWILHLPFPPHRPPFLRSWRDDDAVPTVAAARLSLPMTSNSGLVAAVGPTNIALDSNGAVHDGAKTVTTDDLYYTTNASKLKSQRPLDSGGNVGGDCFIILDSDDDIDIEYSVRPITQVRHNCSSRHCIQQLGLSTMDNNGNVGNFGSMVVDANDTLQVFLLSSANGAALKYATMADGITFLVMVRHGMNPPTMGRHRRSPWIQMGILTAPALTIQTMLYRYTHKIFLEWCAI